MFGFISKQFFFLFEHVIAINCLNQDSKTLNPDTQTLAHLCTLEISPKEIPKHWHIYVHGNSPKKKYSNTGTSMYMEVIPIKNTQTHGFNLHIHLLANIIPV